MKQGIEKQCLFDAGEASFPTEKGVLRHIKGSTRGIESKSVSSGLDHLDYNAQRLFDTSKECVAGLGKVPVTIGATIDCSPTIVEGFISSVLLISRHWQEGQAILQSSMMGWPPKMNILIKKYAQ
jgi:hypothetical protein